jgi:type II secretory pathway pseudopilin PulG
MKSFTLLEGLIVLCIVAIVGALGFFQLNGIQSSASSSLESVSDSRLTHSSDLQELFSGNSVECFLTD